MIINYSLPITIFLFLLYKKFFAKYVDEYNEKINKKIDETPHSYGKAEMVDMLIPMDFIFISAIIVQALIFVFNLLS